MKVAYTVKIEIETSASSPALALHEAGEKWGETKAKFEEIGGVEVVRVAPVIVPKSQGTNGTEGSAPNARAARTPAGASAE